jgi:hypothetical protein
MHGASKGVVQRVAPRGAFPVFRGLLVVDHCFNPECNRELRYLREGRVVRLIHDNGNETRVEHFWLCGNCSETHEFLFTPGGSIGLRLRIDSPVASKFFTADDVSLHWPISSQE